MSQLRTVGLRLALFGTIGGGLWGLFTWGRRRKLTTADIMKMSPGRFRAHVDNIGLTDQVTAALSRLDRDAA